MDEGTDCLEILQGSIYPLKLGYYGVKCRSQMNINQKIPIQEARAAEADFFNRHPIYSSQSHKMGTPYLTR